MRYHVTIAIVPDINSSAQYWFYDQEFDSEAEPPAVTTAAEALRQHLEEANAKPDMPGVP